MAVKLRIRHFDLLTSTFDLLTLKCVGMLHFMHATCNKTFDSIRSAKQWWILCLTV